MDRMTAIAGALTLLLSAAHSILGEKLVFSRLRKAGVWSEGALNLMSVRRWLSVRATWHLVSILASGVAGLLLARAFGPVRVEFVLGVTFLVAAIFWAIATRLGHPAWIVMAGIGILLLIPT